MRLNGPIPSQKFQISTHLLSQNAFIVRTARMQKLMHNMWRLLIHGAFVLNKTIYFPFTLL